MSVPAFSDWKPVAPGLVSIIVLLHRHDGFTSACTRSIKAHIAEPHEVLMITPENDSGVVGFSQGANMGLRAAAGEYILLTDGSTAFTPQALSGMLECLRREPDAGLVAPMMNRSGETPYINGRQLVPETEIVTPEQADDFARSFRKRYRHRRAAAHNVTGGCFLFRRKLAEEIGLFDERYDDPWYEFEDEDYGIRAGIAGYSHYIAGDVFVFRQTKDPFIRNNRKFRLKWMEQDKESREGRICLIRSALERARRLAGRGECDAAVEMLLNAAGIRLDAPKVYLAMAALFLEANLPNDCLAILKELPEAHRHPDAVILNGYARLKLGDANAAARLADAALQMRPLSAPALNLSGEIVYAQGQPDVAARWFRKAASADPGYGPAHTNLGMLHWEAGRAEAALKSFTKGFLLSPDNADVRQIYLNALRKVDCETEPALSIIRNSRCLHPHIRALHFALIERLLASGDNTAAMEEIEENLVQFGMDDGVLEQALAVRKDLGPEKIDPEKTEPTVSACMIVKNEEKYLARCLHSIKPVCDEIILADTGSEDRSRDIALAFGASVFDFEWVDDFSAARNFTLSKASGDWIFIPDGDEVIAPSDYPVFMETLKSNEKSAFIFHTRNYILSFTFVGRNPNDGFHPELETGAGWRNSVKVRLFPNSPMIRFSYPLHEMVEPALRKADIKIKHCTLAIHHYGMIDTGKSRAKNRYYYELGIEKLKERKNQKNYHFIWELASTATAIGEYSHAVELWKILIENNPDRIIESCLCLSLIYESLNQYDDMLSSCRMAYSLAPESPETMSHLSKAYFLAGDMPKAIATGAGLHYHDSESYHAGLVIALAKACNGEKETAVNFITRLKTCLGIELIAPEIERFCTHFINSGLPGYADIIFSTAAQCGIMAKKRILPDASISSRQAGSDIPVN
ncbi:MAG: hypothetical protein CSB33_02770 [Desulfobacterales bacterium]|nr:MAG: hypothetical protein CSB33_02770 [Desulfobacterales bacterium]